MKYEEILKKVATFKDIYNHFGGKIGFYIANENIYFFVENSKFGTPTEIKLNKYDLLHYFTDYIELSNEAITKKIIDILNSNSNLLEI